MKREGRETCVKPGQRTQRLVDQQWVQELLTRESFTSKEAGELSGRYGPDTLSQLRTASGLRLVTLGRLPGGHPQAKLFKLVRLEEERQPMTLNEIGAESLRCSAEKGFDTVTRHDWELTTSDRERMLVPTKLMLIVTEAAEACEEFRKGHNLEAFGAELADIIIRVGQLGVGLGIDLDAAVAAKLAKNRGREHRHGGRLI